MKLLSVAVPCYNSQNYMQHCVQTLLSGGEDIEIIIVNDGSKDETKTIADTLAQKHPNIIKVVHQQNGGHGCAVMAGLSVATGVYFKVVDSDDWVNEQALQSVINKLRTFVHNGDKVDLCISNFVYDKVGQTNKKVMQYTNVLPENKIFTWGEIGRFKLGQYILMHSAIYRTEFLKSCDINLPKHTFYVDNLYVYIPLQSVQTMYYLNVNLYHYFIGREDQSVNEKVMISRIDQQILVNKIMLDRVNLRFLKNKKQRQYMYNFLEIVTIVSSVLLIKSNLSENLDKKQELWQYIAKHRPWEYKRLCKGIMGTLVNLPGRAGRSIATSTYRISQRVIGFN